MKHTDVKKGDKVLCVEGPSKGCEGEVTKIAREFDRDTATTRWTVWFDTEKYKVKTRLAWIRLL